MLHGYSSRPAPSAWYCNDKRDFIARHNISMSYCLNCAEDLYNKPLELSLHWMETGERVGFLPRLLAGVNNRNMLGVHIWFHIWSAAFRRRVGENTVSLQLKLL